MRVFRFVGLFLIVGSLGILALFNIYTGMCKTKDCGYGHLFESLPADKKSDRCVVLFHGFVGSPADFGELKRDLINRGYDVFAPVLPGHCARPDQLESISVADLENFAVDVLSDVRKRYDKVGVVGFSMGGALSLRAAQQIRLDCLALVCPFFKVRHRFFYVLPVRFWTDLLLYIMPYAVKNDYFCMVNRPDGKKNVLAYRVFPLAFAKTLYHLGDLAESTQGVDCPLFMVYSNSDLAADPGSMEDVARRLGAETVCFDRSNHHLMHDYDRKSASVVLCDFIDECLKP